MASGEAHIGLARKVDDDVGALLRHLEPLWRLEPLLLLPALNRLVQLVPHLLLFAPLGQARQEHALVLAYALVHTGDGDDAKRLQGLDEVGVLVALEQHVLEHIGRVIR